jgi:hypothetical protein
MTWLYWPVKDVFICVNAWLLTDLTIVSWWVIINPILLINQYSTICLTSSDNRYIVIWKLTIWDELHIFIIITHWFITVIVKSMNLKNWQQVNKMFHYDSRYKKNTATFLSKVWRQAVIKMSCNWDSLEWTSVEIITLSRFHFSSVQKHILVYLKSNYVCSFVLLSKVRASITFHCSLDS